MPELCALHTPRVRVDIDFRDLVVVAAHQLLDLAALRRVPAGYIIDALLHLHASVDVVLILLQHVERLWLAVVSLAAGISRTVSAWDRADRRQLAVLAHR